MSRSILNVQRIKAKSVKFKVMVKKILELRKNERKTVKFKKKRAKNF